MKTNTIIVREPEVGLQPAIRTVSQTDDVHVIEGLIAFGGPFKGRDSYLTYFSARTDWALDLHPEGVPILWNHGFDEDFGLSPIGRSMPTASFRMADDGMWVQAQLDKRHQYYATRVLPMLDAAGVGLSQGSAEHSVRVDPLTKEVLVWPLQEISLTPTEANPWNVVAARTAEFVSAFRIVDPDAVRVIQTFGDLIAAAEMSEELPEAFDTLTSAIYSALYATDADWNPVPIDDKRTAIQTSLDEFRDHILGLIDKPDAERSGLGSIVRSAIRAGRRNSTSDQSLIDQIHEASATLGATAHAAPDGQPDDDASPVEEPADAARSGDVLPTTFVIVERTDPDAVRAHMEAEAERVGRETAARLLRA